MRTVAEFAAMGGTRVEVYGGEPLLVRYVYELLSFAAAEGLCTSICTNGTLLSAQRVRALLDTSIREVTISVDGAPSTNDSVRGAGVYDRVSAGAHRLGVAADARNHHLTIDLHVTVSAWCTDQLVAVIELAHAVGPRASVSMTAATRVPDLVMRDTERELMLLGDRGRNHWTLPDSVLVSDAQLRGLAHELEHCRRRAAELDVTLVLDPSLTASAAADLPRAVFRLTRPCSVFNSTIMVGPEGATTSCPMLTHAPSGWVGELSLSDVWQNDAFQRARIRLDQGPLPVCSHCCNHAALQ